MVTIRRLDDYPHVLVVTGSEIRHDSYRDDLRRELLDSPTSPVRRGTHHFWITYFVPTTHGGEYDGGDLTTRPAKFRGVIRMGRLPGDTSADSVARQMRTMLEEVGHHWLVPTDLQFEVNGQREPLANATDWTRYVSDGTRLPGIPLLGRGGLHWQSYLQADKSPLDGQWWTDPRQEGLFTVWTNRAFPGPMLRPAALPEVQLTTAFSDLDLAIIGSIAKEDAYPNSGNEFQWIEPVLVTPLPYHVGVCVCFSRTDLVAFGYDQDHRALGVYRSAGVLGGSRVASTRPVPFPTLPFGVALRVVRRGDTYHFQARGDEAVGAHLHPEPHDLPGGVATAPRIRGLFDDLDRLPAATSSPDLAHWATIATLPATAQPQAIGLIVNKWDHPSFVEGAFFNLEMRSGTRDTVRAFTSVPATLAAGTSLSQLGDEPRLDLPFPDVIVRARGRGVLLVTAPYAVVRATGALENLDHFGHSATDDRAPKVLVRAPAGDFAFGTSVTVNRSFSNPWAAGYLRNKEAWGFPRALAVRNAVFPDSLREKQLRPNTTSNFKFAFIVAASKDADVTKDMVKRVDVTRRYWDEALPAAMRSRLRSTSTL